MIQSVDSERLLTEISDQAIRNNRVIDCLLQVFIASEETKFGFAESELVDLLAGIRLKPLPGVRVRGLMGLATFTENQEQIRMEFRGLKSLFERVRKEYFSDQASFDELSMGMSGDYALAIEEGSTLVRIGTRIFGSR
jgi:pyridoxal phosphate enzyme (YggS family)